VRSCPCCGVVLVTQAELAAMLDMPHSTVGLRLRKLRVAPLVREGAREGYVAAQVLPLLIKGESGS